MNCEQRMKEAVELLERPTPENVRQAASCLEDCSRRLTWQEAVPVQAVLVRLRVLLESAMEIRLSSIRHLHAEAAGYAVGEGAAAGPPRPRSPAEAFPPRLIEVEA